jgi:hypothetical protein
MRDTIHIFIAFILAFIGTFIMINGLFNWLLITLIININVINLPVLFIMIILIFNKNTWVILKKIHRYTWLIIICYLSKNLSYGISEL